MSRRVTLLLVAAAACAILLALRLHERAPERGAVATAIVGDDDLPVEAVIAIRVDRPPLEPVHLERRGGAWVETAPFAIAVDPFQVRETILAARQLRATRRLDADRLESDGATLESLSLRPPLATVTFILDGGRETVIRLGRLGVAGRAYVQVGERDDVLVVDQDLHRRLLGDGTRTWRERTLFPEASVENEKIALRAGEVRTELVRNGRAWSMRTPVATRADAAAVNGLIQALARAQCDGFVAENPEDLASFGLHAPVGSATIRTRTSVGSESAERTLLIGGPIVAGGSDRYAMFEGRPLVMRLSGATLGSIFPAAPTLIAPTAAAGGPEDVRAIEIDATAARTRVERTPLGWRDDLGADASTTTTRQIEQLLEQLLVGRATAISLQEYPDTLHHATVTLIGFDDSPLATVRIAIDDRAGQWAAEAGDGVLRIYPISQLPELPTPAETTTPR